MVDIRNNHLLRLIPYYGTTVMNLQFKSLFWKLTLPVVAVGLLAVVILSFVIPSQIKSITVDNAISEAEKTVKQFKIIRGYYTNNIVKTVL